MQSPGDDWHMLHVVLAGACGLKVQCFRNRLRQAFVGWMSDTSRPCLEPV